MENIETAIDLALVPSTLTISLEGEKLIEILHDGTVKTYKEGCEQEASKIFYESLQFEGQTLYQKISSLNKKIEELEKLKAESIVRFKNDCVSIFVHKYGLDIDDMKKHMNCLTDEEYFDYMVGETSTEDYVDEDILSWD